MIEDKQTIELKTALLMQSFLMHRLIDNTRRDEEDMLKQILLKMTGHEVTQEDAKDLTKLYYEDDPLNYDLAYKGVKIGFVKFNIDGQETKVTFYPM